MTIPELEADLAALDAQLRPLMKRKSMIEDELRAERSKEFIRVNKIARADVQSSKGEACGGVWHTTYYWFGEWLRSSRCTKTWCEWNGQLHRTADAKNQQMFEAVAYYEDVPEEK